MRDWKLIDWAVVFVPFFIAFGMLIPLIYRARENRRQIREFFLQQEKENQVRFYRNRNHGVVPVAESDNRGWGSYR